MNGNTKKLKWGFLGLGNMAHVFLDDLLKVDGSELVAVASRNESKAKKFANQYQVSTFYNSYEELLEDPSIDIIYIATPHHNHAELAIKSMESGKHVLCEKPLAVNRYQVQSMIDASKKNQKFLMEALWSRFNPCINSVIDHIKDGDIGTVSYINADFGLVIDKGSTHRIHISETAGGSLLELGVYPVFLAYLIFGKPIKIVAAGKLNPKTGTDIQAGIILEFEKGIANLYSGFTAESDMVAKIYGDEGRIYLDPFWHETESYSIVKGNLTNYSNQDYSIPTKGKGFTYEIEECQKCIASGKIESSKWSHQDSLNLIEIMDEIRSQIGLRYPFEKVAEN